MPDEPQKVSLGDVVELGELIALSGRSGNVDPHLHFGIHDGGKLKGKHAGCTTGFGYTKKEFPVDSESYTGKHGITYYNPYFFINERN